MNQVSQVNVFLRMPIEPPKKVHVTEKIYAPTAGRGESFKTGY